MATKREIVKRRHSIANIRKITKTMEMIATAKFRRTMNRAVGSKLYTEKIAELVSMLMVSSDRAIHPLAEQNTESNRLVLLVVTSNRGLCGGYNASVIRLAKQQIQKLAKSKKEVDLWVFGKKGISALRYAGHEIRHSYIDFDDKLTFAQVEELADELIDLYQNKQIDEVRIVFTRFISSVRHDTEMLTLLPIPVTDREEREEEAEDVRIEDYIFSPTPEDIIHELIPARVKMELFQCFMDSVVSEQVARMSAMQAATDNARQMIRALNRHYNRVRQSQITGELLDIMGGAEALK